MEKNFEMLIEVWDEACMFDGIIVPAGFKQRVYEEFFYLGILPKNELVIFLKDGGLFYFITSDYAEIEGIGRAYNWFITSHHPFNSTYEIGVGLMNTDGSNGWIGQAKTQDRITLLRDILLFSSNGGLKTEFYPLETSFKRCIAINGSKCYYLHDYLPARFGVKDRHQKQISNLIYRFKEGGCCGKLVAKIISLCMAHIDYIGDPEQTVLIPIPAATQERHRKRLPQLCYHLSRWLNVKDGFPAIWIKYDRAESKGKKKKRILSNMNINRKYIEGKHILLFDDVFTTGQSFMQLQSKLIALGAKSVTGIFLAKTSHSELISHSLLQK